MYRELLNLTEHQTLLKQHLIDFAGITKEVVAVRAGAYWRLMAK